MALPVTGDVTQRGKANNGPTCFTGIVSVTSANLSDKTHNVNNKLISGKKAGAIVFNSTTGELMVAQGSTDVAVWNNAGPVAANITPA